MVVSGQFTLIIATKGVCVFVLPTVLRWSSLLGQSGNNALFYHVVELDSVLFTYYD